jgi:hypothetical protein
VRSRTSKKSQPTVGRPYNIGDRLAIVHQYVVPTGGAVLWYDSG